MTDLGALSDDPKRMDGKTLWVFADSFSQPIGDATPFPQLLASDRGMALTNKGVSSSFMRDIAMRMVRDRPVVPDDGFAVINGGINSLARNGASNPLARKSEMAALQAAILMIAQDAAWQADKAGNVVVGQWDPYSSPAMSGGAAATTSGDGLSVTWTQLPAGSWFALGLTLRAGAGGPGVNAVASTGRWAAGATLVMEAHNEQPAPTALEQAGSGDSALNFVPWPAHFPVMPPNGTIRVTSVSANGLTVADSIYHVRPRPPITIVLLPTQSAPGSQYPISPFDLAVIKGDMRRSVADVTSRYPALRGRVIVVDPEQFGWDPALHTLPDGLHPNPAGHRVLTDGIERSVARAEIVTAFMASFGLPGPGFSSPVDWPTY